MRWNTFLNFFSSHRGKLKGCKKNQIFDTIKNYYFYAALSHLTLPFHDTNYFTASLNNVLLPCHVSYGQYNIKYTLHTAHYTWRPWTAPWRRRQRRYSRRGCSSLPGVRNTRDIPGERITFSGLVSLAPSWNIMKP